MYTQKKIYFKQLSCQIFPHFLIRSDVGHYYSPINTNHTYIQPKNETKIFQNGNLWLQKNKYSKTSTLNMDNRSELFRKGKR